MYTGHMWRITFTQVDMSIDRYYLDDTRLLRTHTSAHQTELLKGGSTKFLCTGDGVCMCYMYAL